MRHRHGAKRAIHFLLAANHDSHDAGKPLTSNLQQGGAVHFRHANVGNNHVEWFFRQQIERRFSVGRECRLPRKSLPLQHSLKRFQRFVFIIHKKDSFHSQLLFPCLYLAPDRPFVDAQAGKDIASANAITPSQ